MITDNKIIEIFCLLDDFSKEYNTLVEPNKRKPRKRNRTMSDLSLIHI